MGLRIDQPANVVFEFRTDVLGLLSPSQVAGVLAPDAGPAFVESGGDRRSAPTENHLGLPGGPVTILDGGVGLKLTATMARQKVSVHGLG